ncbi:MAG: mannonate dehydratase [Lentilitoribacter sp.]
MKQTWRWFGPADTISIDDLLQAGVEGVVSALHHIQTGAVWPVNEIEQRQKLVEKLQNGAPSGIKWDVVESLPVSERIKTQSDGWRDDISNYIESLNNLAACGIKTVCYNFMPVLDWTRTELRSKLPHGGTAMRFNIVEFACFDIHILKRDNAQNDYTSDIAHAASECFEKLDQNQQDALQHNIIAGLPGANDNWGLDDIKNLLETYKDIDADKLRQNLIDFLSLVIPTCEKLGINMCCHPDDPPFSIMGLPRIMSSPDDYALIMQAVDSTNNGITLCTGSLGVAKGINFEEFISQWGHRIHFVHLRNTTREGPSSAEKHSFYEAAHLEGDTNMVSVIAGLLNEEKNRQTQNRKDCEIPMRPDHGQEILDDLTKNSMPGYPLIGRVRGLAELRGIMKALE